MLLQTGNTNFSPNYILNTKHGSSQHLVNYGKENFTWFQVFFPG